MIRARPIGQLDNDDAVTYDCHCWEWWNPSSWGSDIIHCTDNSPYREDLDVCIGRSWQPWYSKEPKPKRKHVLSLIPTLVIISVRMKALFTSVYLTAVSKCRSLGVQCRDPPLFKTALFFILKTRKRLAFYKCRCRLQIRSHDNFIEGSMKMTHYSRIDFQEGFRLPPAS